MRSLLLLVLLVVWPLPINASTVFDNSYCWVVEMIQIELPNELSDGQLAEDGGFRQYCLHEAEQKRRRQCDTTKVLLVIVEMAHNVEVMEFERVIVDWGYSFAADRLVLAAFRKPDPPPYYDIYTFEWIWCQNCAKTNVHRVSMQYSFTVIPASLGLRELRAQNCHIEVFMPAGRRYVMVRRDPS